MSNILIFWAPFGVGYEVMKALTIFWDVTPYSPVEEESTASFCRAKE
jgi:hypothetical protein